MGLNIYLIQIVQLVVQYFITSIILWYHNMVGNCKLIIKPLNLIFVYCTLFLENLKYSFTCLNTIETLNSILLVFNTRILIQILNQKTSHSIHPKNISNNHNNPFNGEQNSNADSSNYRQLDHSQLSRSTLGNNQFFPLPSPIAASRHGLAFSPTPTYYLDAVSTFSPPPSSSSSSLEPDTTRGQSTDVLS